MMTTLYITLSGDLAHKAHAAGLLSSDAIVALLQEQLSRQTDGSLIDLLHHLPPTALTNEVEHALEQEIVAVVRTCRADKRITQKLAELSVECIAQVENFIDFLRERDAAHGTAGASA